MSRVVVHRGRVRRAGLRRAAGQARSRGHPPRALDALGGALAPVAEGGFTWDAGADVTLLPAVIRDLFRKSGRPVERELDLVQLRRRPRAPLRGRHRGRAAGRAGRPDRRVRRPRSPAGPAVGGPRRVVRRRLGRARAGTTSRRRGTATPSPASSPAAGQPRGAAQAAAQDVPDDRLRMVAGHPFVAEGTTCATCRPGRA
jgi:UDP-galactopyranose mutase